MIKKRTASRRSASAEPGSLAAFEALKSLQMELRRMRSLAKEIAAAYVSKLEARAEQMADRLNEVATIDAGAIGIVLKKIRGLNVKPHKGRRKDLRKLEELLEGMQSDVEALVDGSDKPATAGESNEKKRRPQRAG